MPLGDGLLIVATLARTSVVHHLLRSRCARRLDLLQVSIAIDRTKAAVAAMRRRCAIIVSGSALPTPSPSRSG